MAPADNRRGLPAREIYQGETVDRIREMEKSHTVVRVTLSGKVIGVVNGVTKRARATRFSAAEIQEILMVRSGVHGGGDGGSWGPEPDGGDRPESDL